MTLSKKRPLNIGLGKMLSNANVTTITTGDQLRTIPLEAIQPGAFQPRRDFDGQNLQELAESIRMQGIVQPIILRQIKPQHYEIIAGERRWRAAQMAGLATIPAVIKEISDQAVLAIGLIENIQRQDLNALEEANALARLIEEFSLTHDQAAKAVGKSRVMVSNLLRLLQLDEQVKVLLERNDLEMGHARSLLPLSLTQQRAAAKQIVERQLSVRETESLVKKMLTDVDKKSAPSAKKINPNLAKLQRELSDHLGTKVNFLHRKSGAGKIVIEYTNLDVLSGVLDKIHLKRKT